MIEPSRHVVFSPTAAQTLNQALKLARRTDQVLCLVDDFSFGPIASGDPATRIRGVEQILGLTEWRSVIAETSTFLAAYNAVRTPVVAWLSRRDTYSYAGFLWWLARSGTASVMLADAGLLRGVSGMDVIATFNQAVAISPDERVSYQRRWKELEEEDSSFRVIDGEDLVSAPLDYFDASLLRHATGEWRTMARIVGMMFLAFEQTGLYQTGDAVLAARLAALARAGRLEWRGDLADMAQCDLRLPANREHSLASRETTF